MATAKKHTAASLKDLDLKSLQKIAKSFGLVTAGKRVAELVKAILAAQDGAAKGKKKTAGKKTAGRRAAATDDGDDDDEDEEEDEDPEEEEEEEADEDEDDEPPAKSGKGAKGGKGLDLASIDKRLTAVEALLSKSTKAKAPAKVEEEDEDEDPEEEEEEESETEELTITLDSVNEADLSELKEIAAQINEHEGEKVIKFEKVTKAGPLRESIRDYLNEHADKIEEEDEDGEEEEEEDEDEAPAKAAAWMKPKAKCQAKYEKKWYPAVIRKVGKKMVTVYFPADKAEADLPFSDIKKA